MHDAIRASGKRASIDHLEAREIDRLRASGALFVDPKRVRPRYFDGRFLAARDLQRDQDYFFERQRDLAQLAGAGVLAGLQVRASGDSAVEITPGVGISERGELVVIPDMQTTTRPHEPLRVDLSDLPAIQRLGFELGVLDAPNRPARQPSGLFVLALRAVHYTANPQGAYPATLTERRKVDDADVIEATAVTLIPYPAEVPELTAGAQRALVAQGIFTRTMPAGVPADAVPLAMLQLSGGKLEWLDVHMVRREIGPERAEPGSHEQRSRAMCEAHALQYQQHLADLLAERSRSGQSPRFAAGDAFSLLPAAGPLPAAAVDVAGGSQSWFPPHVHVSLAFVPPDEVAPLIEESLLLPPIDLRESAEAAGLTAVLILAPRARFTLPSAVPAATPAAPARRSGGLIGSLADIVRNGFPSEPTTGGASAGSAPAAPASVESDASLLWYVRCRTQYLLPDAQVVATTGG